MAASPRQARHASRCSNGPHHWKRAVFLLREVFEYEYDEIAAIVQKSEANCRQILSRARKHVEADNPRFEVGGPRQAQLADSFLAAMHEGDLERLVGYLAEDAVFYGCSMPRDEAVSIDVARQLGAASSSSWDQGAGRYRQTCTPVAVVSAETSSNRRASPSLGNRVFPPPSVIGSMQSSSSSTNPAVRSDRTTVRLP